jgi:hypothetical protein
VVVRVKVEVKHGDRVFATAAVANSGYETEEPELHLPLALARSLGISLHALPGESYRVVGGSTHAYVLGEVLVRVVADDRSSDWVRARAVSVPGEHEVLLSDKLLDALGIEIIKAGLGYWRFSGESPERVRRSVEAQFWVE